MNGQRPGCVERWCGGTARIIGLDKAMSQDYRVRAANASRQVPSLTATEVGPILYIEPVALFDRGQCLGNITGFESLGYDSLVSDLHDGAAQNRVIVAAQLSKDSPGFCDIVEASLELLDEHEGVVVSLSRLEAL